MPYNILKINVIILVFGILLTACAAAPGTTNNNGGGGSTEPVGPGVYVSVTGNDTNVGTNASAPMLTIQNAITKAVLTGLTNIYVAGGTYTNGAGLVSTNLTGSTNSGIWISNSNIALSGGWNSGFTARTGQSLLNGNQQVKHVITVGGLPIAVKNIVIDGFAVIGGTADITPAVGGGINFINANNILISNTTISNNYAIGWGGGVCLDSCNNIAIFADIASNRCDSSGGGIFTYYCQSILISSKISGNFALSDGGGVYINENCSAITQYGQVLSNRADSVYGGGIRCDGYSCVFNADISWNSSANYGGGIFLNTTSYDNTLSGTVAFNTAASGGGVCFLMASNNLLTNLTIASNSVTGSGGGLLLMLADHNRIFSTITGNYTPNWGGGIYLNGCFSNTIKSTISHNTAIQGGGIGSYECSNLVIGGTISGNLATNGCGGGLILMRTRDITLTANVINNAVTTGGRGGGLYIDYITNIYILNSVMTNNSSFDGYPYGNSSVNTGWGMGFVMISNCLIGASNNGGGIREDTELTGHVVKDNTFATNGLSFLYYDVNGTYITTPGATWTNINATDYSGASIATGNKVTNL